MSEMLFYIIAFLAMTFHVVVQSIFKHFVGKGEQKLLQHMCNNTTDSIYIFFLFLFFRLIILTLINTNLIDWSDIFMHSPNSQMKVIAHLIQLHWQFYLFIKHLLQ